MFYQIYFIYMSHPEYIWYSIQIIFPKTYTRHDFILLPHAVTILVGI